MLSTVFFLHPEALSTESKKRQWEGLRSVGVVESVRQVGEARARVERRYYLSSLGVDVEKF